MVHIKDNPVYAEDVSRLDANSESLGIPTQLLMECAGLQAANEIWTAYNLEPSSEVVIFCGKGNNGGDGFVIARHLASRGIYVNVALLGSPEQIRTEEARMNWNILKRLEFNVKIFILKDSRQVHDFCETPNFLHSSLIVDAILGTGVRGKIRDPISTAIDCINKVKKEVVSIDVPSGLDPNTGKIPDKTIKYTYRISFHMEKKGLEGVDTENDKIILPIGIPVEAYLFIGDGDLRFALKKRQKNTHKGEYGKVLIIGGSSLYSGAPSLAALINHELGIDLVICAVPRSIEANVRNLSPNIIVRSGGNDDFCKEDFDMLEELVEWADSILIGPGMGKSQSTYEFLMDFLPWILNKKKPIVIDADAISPLSNLMEKRSGLLLHRNCVITPHLGELSQFMDVNKIPKNAPLQERVNYIYEHLKNYGGNFLVKGVYDYIINGEPNLINDMTIDNLKYRINTTGCPEMSVGGTGDVLAGIVAGLMALGNTSFRSACVAAYLNGLLGEYSKEINGNRIKATDLIKNCRLFLKSKHI